MKTAKQKWKKRMLNLRCIYLRPHPSINRKGFLKNYLVKHVSAPIQKESVKNVAEKANYNAGK